MHPSATWVAAALLSFPLIWAFAAIALEVQSVLGEIAADYEDLKALALEE